VIDPNLSALQCSEKPSSGIPYQHLSTIMDYDKVMMPIGSWTYIYIYILII
jgi:hypothetical protein